MCSKLAKSWAQISYPDVYNVNRCHLVIRKLDKVPQARPQPQASKWFNLPVQPTPPCSSKHIRSQQTANIASEPDRLAIMSAMMMRVPEPLERVQAMVCEFCWINVFDTETFERLGRREKVKLEYDVSILSQYLFSASIKRQVHCPDVR